MKVKVIMYQYKTVYPIIAECAFFSIVHATFSMIGHILGHMTVTMFKWIEIIQVCKGTRIVKTIFKEKNKVGVLTLHAFETVQRYINRLCCT